LVLLAVVVGVAVKTPTVPFIPGSRPRTPTPPAAGSAILAAVLLKMGTYGLVRIAMPMLPGIWRQYALVFVVIALLASSAARNRVIVLGRPWAHDALAAEDPAAPFQSSSAGPSALGLGTEVPTPGG
jgi:NADH-quinone oxidoreductase subunit M